MTNSGPLRSELSADLPGPSPRALRGARRLVTLASLGTMGLACLILAGWYFCDASHLRDMPDYYARAMKPNTALRFLLTGLAIRLLQAAPPHGLRWRLGKGLAALILVQCLLSVSEYALHIDPGIDELLFARRLVAAYGTVTPGIPAPNTTVCFIFSSLALLGVDIRGRRYHWYFQGLALAVGVMAVHALVSLAYSRELPGAEVSATSLFAPMTLLGAVSFLLISLGIFLLRPDRGLALGLIRDDMGAVLIRRLIPAALLVPFLAGLFRLWGERAGLYGTYEGTSLYVTLSILTLISIIGWSMAVFRRLDARRSQAEEALRWSEEGLELAQEVVHLGSAFVDLQTYHRQWSAETFRLLGYAPGQVEPSREAMLSRIHPEDRFKVDRQFQAGVASPGVTRELYRVVLPDGTLRFLYSAAIVSRDASGSPMRWVGTAQDITEQVRLEQALRESEARFRTAFQDAPIGMAMVGINGQWLEINRALCAIVGYREEELLGRTFQEITHPEDLEPDLRYMARLAAGELVTYQLEKRCVHKDGHVVWVLLTASLVRNEKGQPLYFIAQVQDITERRRAGEGQRLLAETGALLASSLDPTEAMNSVARLCLPVLADWTEIEIFHPDGALKAVTGAAADPDRDRLLHELMGPAPTESGRYRCLIAEVLRTSEAVLTPEVTPGMLEAWSGDPRSASLLKQLDPRSLIVAPLMARGHILGVIMLARSESGRRYEPRDLELARALADRGALALDNAQAYQTAERAVRVRDEVLGFVAHDLRSPLTVISLHTQMLSLRVPEADLGHLELIQQGVNRATGLIQDLLDAARMEGGHIALELRPEEVGPLMRETLEGHRALAEAKSVSLELGSLEALPRILADRSRMQRILANLVGNAVKFTPEGGRVTFEARREDGMVRFLVANTGPGIAAEQLPHLFEPFWQARPGGREGAGLGLSIARGLVEAHGGRIQVESQPGVVTTFHFTIPVEPAEPGEEPTV